MNLWAPLDQNNIQDPFPMYANLREKAPVYKSQTGEWIVSRYSDVRDILKDPRFKSGNKLDWINRGITYFKNKDQDLSAIAIAINSFLLLINPPEHTRIRKLISSVWNDREVDLIIIKNIEVLLNQKRESSAFDIVEDFAQPLPNMTISAIMGVSLEYYEQLTSLSSDLVRVLNLYNSFKDLVRIDSAAKNLISIFKKLLNSKKQTPDNNLISRIIAANSKEKEPLSEQALISICIFLLIAGQETTVGLISTGLMNLSKYPNELKKLVRQPELIPGAIDELLRFDGPVHLLGRIATEDIQLGKQLIKQDDTVTLCLASANRDHHYFKQPDALSIERQPNRHLAFGSGIHYCMGDWLAKRQGALAIERFLKTHPEYHISTQSLQWNDNLSIRTLKHLYCKV